MTNFSDMEFARWNLDWIQNQIKRADEKANIYLAFYLALTGVFVAHVASFVSSWNQFGGLKNMGWLGVGLILAGVACVVMFAIFYCNFYLVVRARTNPRRLLGNDSYSSLIFWGDISQTERTQFEANYPPDEDSLWADLKAQIYANSQIAYRKFRYLNRATWTFLPTIVIIGVFVVLVYCLKSC